MKHRKFSKEFKLEVIREMDAGKPVAQVCRERELDNSLVYQWKKRYDKNPEQAFSKNDSSTLESKNAELERTIGQLYVENDFLKKATAYFSLELLFSSCSLAS